MLKFKTVVERICLAFALIGGSMMLAMIFLTIADVTGRYFFNKPISGTFEISQLMLALLVWCSLPYATYLGAHICADFVSSRVSPRVGAYLTILGSIIGLVFFAAIARQDTADVFTAFREEVVTPDLRIPLWPFKIFLPLMASGACLVFISQVWEAINRTRARPKETE